MWSYKQPTSAVRAWEGQRRSSRLGYQPGGRCILGCIVLWKHVNVTIHRDILNLSLGICGTLDYPPPERSKVTSILVLTRGSITGLLMYWRMGSGSSVVPLLSKIALAHIVSLNMYPDTYRRIPTSLADLSHLRPSFITASGRTEISNRVSRFEQNKLQVLTTRP